MTVFCSFTITGTLLSVVQEPRSVRFVVACKVKVRAEAGQERVRSLPESVAWIVGDGTGNASSAMLYKPLAAMATTLLRPAGTVL